MNDLQSRRALYHRLAEDALDKGNRPLARFYLDHAIRLSREAIQESLARMRKLFVK